MRESMLRDVVFERYFFAAEPLHVDVAEGVVPFLKKFFLADLICYLNEKISNE